MQSIIVRFNRFSKLNLMVLTICMSIILLSNKNGVPQAVTGAPGETAGASCNACHTAGNFVTSLKFQLMTLDSVVVSKYIPGQKYIAKVAVSATNNPKSFGFQMASLIDNGNKDAGVWSSFGTNVKTFNLISRKYLGQSNPNANGLFYSLWTAPKANSGKVSFYYAGLAVNLTGNTTGDSHANTKTTIEEDISAATDQSALSFNYLYPNPIIDGSVNITKIGVSQVRIYDMKGTLLKMASTQNQRIEVDFLSPGIYIIYGTDDSGKKIFSQLLTKI